MGYRNHLPICRHCGIVHATASSTGPERCFVCHAIEFSEYALNEFIAGKGSAADPTDRHQRTPERPIQP